MSIQRRFAPIGGRFEPEQVAGLTGIYTFFSAVRWMVIMMEYYRYRLLSSICVPL
jgi:hypothetical protein